MERNPGFRSACLLCRLESVLAETAPWAYPIIGDVLEGSAGGDTSIGVANFGVVLETAGANIFHGVSLLSCG